MYHDIKDYFSILLLSLIGYLLFYITELELCKETFVMKSVIFSIGVLLLSKIYKIVMPKEIKKLFDKKFKMNKVRIKMINYPLISIAIATYNGEKYLEEQLDSIYAQTYKNIEVIVTDDCSSDKTVEILKKYYKSHGLKYVINETNLGFVKNFEKAISLCRGDYIALSDQDDIWLSTQRYKN